MSEIVNIHTDGSCLGNPGPGGWAVVIITPGDMENRTLRGGDPRTTNNQMELRAAIEGIRGLEGIFGSAQGLDVTLHSDSQYLCKAFNDNWIGGWLKRGWRTSKKQPVLNREMWEELIRVTRGINITWQWVKGHSGDYFNEMCDRIAREEAEAAAGKPGAQETTSGFPEWGGLEKRHSTPQHSQVAAVPDAGNEKFNAGYEAARQEMFRFIAQLDSSRPPALGGYPDGYIDCRREVQAFLDRMQPDNLPF